MPFESKMIRFVKNRLTDFKRSIRLLGENMGWARDVSESSCVQWALLRQISATREDEKHGWPVGCIAPDRSAVITGLHREHHIVDVAALRDRNTSCRGLHLCSYSLPTEQKYEQIYGVALTVTS